MRMIIVLTTSPTAADGEALAEKIIGARLAACVQVLPQMRSVYLWEGTVQKESEHLLLIKTIAEKWGAIKEFIAANHNYDVPEIVAIDAQAADPYLVWLTAELTIESQSVKPITDN